MARVLNVYKCCPINCQRCCIGSSPFTFMDIFLTFLSIGSFLADIGTDIIVIIQYYKNDHIAWMLLTMSLVCLPSLIVQIFSIRWYIIDGIVTNYVWIMHILQLGVFYRYIQLLWLGLKVRKSKSEEDLKVFNQQQSDICMLRLFESFTESAPQLVLQLYIMVSTDEWNLWTGISALASILSLSWGISVYSKAMRNVRPEKKHLSWWGLLFQASWRIGMVSSRVIAMVLFAAAYGYWLILAMSLHWLSMTVWVFIQNTDFCTTWWEERLYNCVVGVIYCFCYFNIKEGRSRYRMSLFYLLTILQSMIFLFAFYFSDRRGQGLKNFMALLVPVGIVTGLISMLVYYRFFHPSGPITLSRELPNVLNEEGKDDNKGDKANCSTLKTCRKMIPQANQSLENCRLSETNSNSSHQYENLNTSRMSIMSHENNTSCTSDLHRSHSLNCSLGSYLLDTSFKFGHNRKSLANHHRNINYHFRSAAGFGFLSSKIHCSCLVLTKDSENSKDLSIHFRNKMSTSLPNLEVSFEANDSDKMTMASSTTKESLFGSSDDLPIIYSDHVIRINVNI